MIFLMHISISNNELIWYACNHLLTLILTCLTLQLGNLFFSNLRQHVYYLKSSALSDWESETFSEWANGRNNTAEAQENIITVILKLSKKGSDLFFVWKASAETVVRHD